MSTTSPPDPSRRQLLGGLLGAYAASLIPWALAQPVADADRGAFLAVSAILTGRRSLDAPQADRLYDALVAEDSGFPVAVRALLAFINERRIAPLQLQKLLDAEKSALTPLPRKIVTAWFMGIVGSGERAHCVEFEKALNAQIVSDVLKPPTYCYGVYASWTKKPT